MTVATWAQPNFNTVADASTYKSQIDAAFAVASRFADWFAPRQSNTPAMNVTLDAGYIWNGSTLTAVASQTSNTMAAPTGTGNSRIDRIVVDANSGAVSVVTGTQGTSPAAPAIPAGKLPVAQVLLVPSTTTVVNGIITDERTFPGLGGDGRFVNLTVTGTLDNSSDERLKTEILDLPPALQTILGLRPVSYLKQHGTEEPHLELGFIAQQVQPLLPELVRAGADEMLALNYLGLLAPMVKAMQEMHGQIAELRQTVQELTNGK